MFRPFSISALLSLYLITPAVLGQLTQNFNFTVGQNVPDGSDSGISNSQLVSTTITDIGSLTIDLDISGRDTGGSGMFNGDLYVTLVHGPGFSILLNRVGRDSSSDFGYADQYGFNIKISDTAALGDVHVYRVTLSGNNSTALTGPLTGSWSPDGRSTDPAAVNTSDPRSALLSSFSGADPNGTWTLFVADLSAGGTCKLNSWGLEITPVPEPALCSMITSLILVAVLALKTLSQARECPSPPRQRHI